MIVSLRNNHLPNTHGLKIDVYEKLIDSTIELQYFKRTNGFTDKFGQCGFCMKQFTEVRNLRRHKLKWHEGNGVKFVEGKLDNKKNERKGASYTK